MKSYSLQTQADKVLSDIESWKSRGVQILLIFASRDTLKDTDICKKIKSALPDAELLGCSTSGEIGNSVEDDSVSLMGLSFENTTIKSACVPIEGADQSANAGAAIGKELLTDDLKGVFVLLPGLNVNGSKFTEGLRDILPSDVSISGGLAGDGLSFETTVTVYNGEVYENRAVGFGLYGDDVQMYSSAKGGWKPFGPLRRVTKVENNVLYELDGKSALELYKEYLGEKANDLPASGLLYPFAIMDEERPDSVGLIRTILDINEDNGSLVLAGDMQVGEKVCLMHANTGELVTGAENAANAVAEEYELQNDKAVICVSCVGRKIVMGDDTEDELDAVRDVFGENCPIAGFYSYGEISMYQDTGKPELHNQTMTITYISEKVA